MGHHLVCPIITHYVHHHIQSWCFTRAPHLAAEMQTCDAHKGKDLGFENCGGKKLIFVFFVVAYLYTLYIYNYISIYSLYIYIIIYIYLYTI